MQLQEWLRIYREICADFSISQEGDRRAACTLAELVRHRTPLSELERLIAGQRVNVFGAGPSLERLSYLPAGTAIACDGATSFLLEHGKVPEVIVTDLDGRVEDVLEANKRGSVVVLHAHADNVEAIRSYAPLLRNVVPTAQSEPPEGVYNFGGFTDGDRAVFLAHALGAREINLYGMDFGAEVGRYSFSEPSERKLRKLEWGQRLVRMLEERGARLRWC
ncbi:MAG: DUF115 domain-containing protein [Euryarchaeota archaeon]|nr:DUF115 domain-containing protein [Euryarchaeota archaeon]